MLLFVKARWERSVAGVQSAWDQGPKVWRKQEVETGALGKLLDLQPGWAA